MTEMRDARFKKALDAAPDADARPASAVAASIRAAARSTPAQPLAGTAATAWWQRWWRRSGSPRAPWNAAFATLLLGVLVTVLWVREPIPDARPIAAAPAAGDVVPPAPPAPIATPVTPAEAVADAARTPQTMPRAKQRPAEPAAAAAPPPMAVADESAARVPDALKLEQPNLGEMQKRAAEQLANKALLADSARAAAPAHQESLAAAPMAAAPVPAAPAPVALPRLDTQGLQAWSTLNLNLEGRVARVDRVQGQALFAQMQKEVARLAQVTTSQVGTAPSASAWALPAIEPRLRVTILQQDQTLAVFSLWANALRWQPAGQPPVLGAIDTTDAQVLIQLAQQALAAMGAAPN